MPRLFADIPFHVNFLQVDGIMANHRILMVWLYARLRPRYGGGPKTALRSGLAAWAVFWVIPMLALMPLDLFPNGLLAIEIALGFVDAALAVLLGAWLYKAR